MDKLTIADCIRRGCERYPKQAFNTGFRRRNAPNQDDFRACVRAAAHVGFAGQAGWDMTFEMLRPDERPQCQEVYDDGHPLNVAMRSIKVDVSEMPNSIQRGAERISLERAMTILNDDCRWSRERIADWVEKKGFDATIREATRSMTRFRV